MGFRKTHRRTKKLGGTRQRGGATQDKVDNAVTDAEGITNESSFEDIESAIEALKKIKSKVAEGVNMEAVNTRLGELQAIAVAKELNEMSNADKHEFLGKLQRMQGNEYKPNMRIILERYVLENQINNVITLLKNQIEQFRSLKVKAILLKKSEFVRRNNQKTSFSGSG